MLLRISVLLCALGAFVFGLRVRTLPWEKTLGRSAGRPGHRRHERDPTGQDLGGPHTLSQEDGESVHATTAR